jgi:hypothetical protein
MTAKVAGQQDSTQVPVGKTTVAGGAGAVVGLIMAIYALAQGDGSEQTWGAIVGGVVFVSSALPTLAGRMLQAYGKIRAQADEIAHSPMVTVPAVHSQQDAADLDARDEIADLGRRVQWLEGFASDVMRTAELTATADPTAPPAPAEIFTGWVITPPDLRMDPTDVNDDPDEVGGEDVVAEVPHDERRDIHEIDEHLGRGGE